jgi:NADPH:quinone reductase-like Zn-dependent oxidoreductase
MRAVLQPSITSPELAMTETPLPTPTHPDDVLLKVAATAPCITELYWRMWNPQFFPADKEPVPGQDVTGTVVNAPPDSIFKPGDEVYCRIHANRPGGAREYTLARVGELAHRPKSLDWIQSTAVPLSALTAFQALFTQGTLESAGLFGVDEDPAARAARQRNAQKRVLIPAAAGSVGSWAVRFAAEAGAGAVVGVNSCAKAEYVRGLGATQTVDYKQQNVADWVAADPANREADLIVDCAGGDHAKHLWAAVKEGGAIVSVCLPPDSAKPEGTTKTVAKSVFFIVDPLGAQLADITRLIDARDWKPLVDSTFNFTETDVRKAFEKADSRTTYGKVVIKVGI